MKTIFIFLIALIMVQGSKKATVNQDKSLDKHCVKCHIMYYPEFLPSRSWKLLLTNNSLKKHFGENVTLEHKVVAKFLSYYLKYSSNNKHNKLARKVNRSIPSNQTPKRLIKTPYHKDKHEDLKDKMVLKNKKVKSYSNCKACHNEGYKKGVFDEDDVDIPGWSKGLFGWSKK